MLDKTQLNAFEDVDHSPFYLRACIGNNSGIANNDRDISIFDGFVDVVDLCYKHIGKLTIDTAIYPFMYCCRHAIELILKQIIRELTKIQAIKKDLSYQSLIDNHRDCLNAHNIKVLVDVVIECSKIDSNIDQEMSKLSDVDTLLSEFYIDEKSDTYRYTFDTSGNEHLKDEGLIGLDIVHEKFTKATEFFRNFYYYICNVYQEYQTGTHTKELSRIQIRTIATLLPDVSKWKDESFETKKQEICLKYNISRNELCRAIDIIKKHREFCTFIGMEIPFMTLDDDFLQKTVQLIKMSEEMDKLMPKTIPDPAHLKDFPKMPDMTLYKQKALKIVKTLDTQSMFILFTFINIGQYEYYSEYLNKVYEHISNQPRNEMYLLSKCFDAYSYSRLLKGLKKCGQTSYIKRIETFYVNVS